ncbi:PC-esterase domain-containing protein 1A-like [Rhineura floridana]|uniref:PC-esterase domain-containing protein 1A-like n=1 Tax=Rhineura floridana TaxID=261503 RepID=UPI002AC8415E|nr:PC-esterase domain-containing protein 1A-like [Rhineura floridana]
MLNFNSKEARQLLHNKFVVILGDSIQRSVYKDLIWLLQSDSLLTSSQMRAKGELYFENDHLIEGGVLEDLHNGTHYREVRQYRTCHHLVRFYFLTRVYSAYLESILDDFKTGLQPDILVLNSCVWDVSRYGPTSMKEYRTNLETAFNRLDAVLPSSSLVIWNMTMPLGPKVTGGFLIPELQHLNKTLRNDVIEGNFYGATLAGFHLFNVLDLHFHFRFDLRNRVKDGVHWNNVVHRRITKLLLAHVADAWGVVIPDRKRHGGPVWDTSTVAFDLLPAVPLPPRLGTPQAFPGHHDIRRLPYIDPPQFYDDSPFVPNARGLAEPFSGFSSFEDSHFPPIHLDAVALNNFCRFESASLPYRSLISAYPSHNEENIPPRSRHHRRKTRLIGHHDYIMRRPSYCLRDNSPYRRPHPVPCQRY